jgi:hypothetical protein
MSVRAMDGARCALRMDSFSFVHSLLGFLVFLPHEAEAILEDASALSTHQLGGS